MSDQDRYHSFEELDRRCQAFFRADEHEYVGGTWRINGVALHRRLSQLHTEWSCTPPVIGQVSSGGLQSLAGVQIVTVSASLLFLGATRSAIVSAAVQRDAAGKVSGDNLVKALQEAQDNLLMALAQQWNIAAYCRDIPSEITTPDQLAEWLGR